MEKKDEGAHIPEEKYQRAQDSLHHIRERVIDLVERVKDEVVNISKVGRKKLDIISLKKERDAFLTSLGKRTYDLIKQGAIKIPELTTLSAKLDEFSERLSSIEREVEDMARKSHGRKEEKGASVKSRIRVKKRPPKKPGSPRGDEEE